MFTCRNNATKRASPVLHENDLKLGMYFWPKWSVLLAWVADKVKSEKMRKGRGRKRYGDTLVIQPRVTHGLITNRVS